MAKKSVEFHPEAAAELEAAFDWYLQRNESVAVGLFREVSHAIAEITKAPARWTVGDHGARSFYLRRFPFIIFYRDLPDRLQIVAVAHQRRRPGYWKSRSTPGQ